MLTFLSVVEGLGSTGRLGLDCRLTFGSGDGEVGRSGELFDGNEEGTVILILGSSLDMRMRKMTKPITPTTAKMRVRMRANGV